MALHEGRWNVTKLVLRSISFVIGVVIIGLSGDDGRRLMMIEDGDPSFLYDWSFTFPIVSR